ncbi:helix-turn-helix domain-containing protein [Paraglaciecola sp.]|uniref:AraC family transcriptional regulator n=1 Tax=Paraglaciecola sp. TaxID=1920173 RepID=UPI003EF37F92
MHYSEEFISTIEGYKEATKEASMEAIQLTTGSFDMFRKALCTANLSIVHVDIFGEVHHHGTMANNHYYFMFPNTGSTLNFCGLDMLEQHIIVSDNTRNISALTHQNYSGIAVSIEKNLLHQYIGISTLDICQEVSLKQIMFPQTIQIKSQLLSYISTLFRHAVPLKKSCVSKDVCDQVGILLSQLIQPLTELESFKERAFSTRQNILLRSLEYIEQHTPHPITIAELCVASFCSVRTLEYTFKNLLGISPKRCITVYRLHQIRKALLQKGTHKIGPLLDTYGIVNAGRFSQDYFTLFGEYPKDTIN